MSLNSTSSSAGLLGITQHWSLELLYNASLSAHTMRFSVVFSGQTYDSAPFALSLGKFTHLACTLNGADLEFSLDGTLISAVPFAEPPPAWPSLAEESAARLYVGAALPRLPSLVGLVNEVILSYLPPSYRYHCVYPLFVCLFI